MPSLQVDISATAAAAIAAPGSGKRILITSYHLQGTAAATATAQLQNADDSSVLDTIVYGPTGGGIVYPNTLPPLVVKENVALKIALSGTDRLVGKIDYQITQ